MLYTDHPVILRGCGKFRQSWRHYAALKMTIRQLQRYQKCLMRKKLPYELLLIMNIFIHHEW